jgi:hypothetical protein
MTKNTDRVSKRVKHRHKAAETVIQRLPVTIGRGRSKNRGIVGDGT